MQQLTCLFGSALLVLLTASFSIVNHQPDAMPGLTVNSPTAPVIRGDIPLNPIVQEAANSDLDLPG